MATEAAAAVAATVAVATAAAVEEVVIECPTSEQDFTSRTGVCVSFFLFIYLDLSVLY